MKTLLLILAAATLAVPGNAELILSADGLPILPPLEESQRVLSTKIINTGKDTLSYRRVTPPTPRPLVFREVPPIAISGAANQWEEEPLDYSYICFSVVPYPFNVSEIQWSDEEGRQKRVFVHDDLTFLDGSFSIAVEGKVFDFGNFNWGGYDDKVLGNYPEEIRRYINLAQSLPPGAYLPAATSDGGKHPLTVGEYYSLDVLLAYYQVNRSRLKTERLEAQALAEAEAEAKRIRDAKPKKIEIRFWPTASQRYPTSR